MNRSASGTQVVAYEQGSWQRQEGELEIEGIPWRAVLNSAGAIWGHLVTAAIWIRMEVCVLTSTLLVVHRGAWIRAERGAPDSAEPATRGDVPALLAGRLPAGDQGTRQRSSGAMGRGHYRLSLSFAA